MTYEEELNKRISTPEKEIETYRQQFASYSRSKLIEEINRWLPHSARHIAAKQLIDEIDKKDSDKKHNRILIVSILTLIVALLTFAVAVTGFSWKDFLALLSTDHKKQELKITVGPEKPTPTKGIPLSTSNRPNNKEPPLNKKQKE